MTHALKTWPEYFKAVIEGQKKFEVRKDDRHFKLGDKLLLQEYDAERREYTGEECEFTVGCILRGPAFGIKKGYCVMSLDVVKRPKDLIVENGAHSFTEGMDV